MAFKKWLPLIVTLSLYININDSIHAFSSKAIHETDNQDIIYHEQYSFDWHNNEDWDIIEKHNYNPPQNAHQKKRAHRRSLKSYTVIEGASIHDDINSNSIRDVYKNKNMDKVDIDDIFNDDIKEIENGDIYDQLNKQKFININPILKCSKPLPVDNYIRLCVRWDNGHNFHFNFDQQHPQVVNKKNHHIHININNDSCWNHHHQLHNLLHYDNIRNVYDHSHGINKIHGIQDKINTEQWNEALMHRIYEEMWKENEYFKLMYSNKNKKCENINGLLICMEFGIDPTQKHHLRFTADIPRLMRKRKRKEGNGNRMVDIKKRRKQIRPYSHIEAKTKSSLSPSLTTSARNHSWNTIWLRWSNSNDWDYIQIIKHVNHIQCTHSIPGLLYYDLCVMLNKDGIHFRLFRLDPKAYDDKMLGAIVTTLFSLKAKENQRYQYTGPQFVEKRQRNLPKIRPKTKTNTKKIKKSVVRQPNVGMKQKKKVKIRKKKRKLLDLDEEELEMIETEEEVIELLQDIMESSDTADFYQNMDLSDFWSFENDDDWSTISYHDQNEFDFDVKEFDIDDESELEEEFLGKVFKSVSKVAGKAFKAVSAPVRGAVQAVRKIPGVGMLTQPVKLMKHVGSKVAAVGKKLAPFAGLAGTAIGTALGGPVGGMIGGAIGGWIGKRAGKGAGAGAPPPDGGGGPPPQPGMEQPPPPPMDMGPPPMNQDMGPPPMDMGPPPMNMGPPPMNMGGQGGPPPPGMGAQGGPPMQFDQFGNPIGPQGPPPQNFNPNGGPQPLNYRNQYGPPMMARQDEYGEDEEKDDDNDEEDLSDYMYDYHGFSSDSISILNDYLKNNMFIYSDIDAVNMNKMKKYKEIKKCKNFKIINEEHHEIPIVVCAVLDPHIMQLMIEINIGKYGKLENVPNKLDRKMHKKMMKMSMTQKTIYVN